jgi:hypothetical protein
MKVRRESVRTRSETGTWSWGLTPFPASACLRAPHRQARGVCPRPNRDRHREDAEPVPNSMSKG